jgi:hypothetical protein
MKTMDIIRRIQDDYGEIGTEALERELRWAFYRGVILGGFTLPAGLIVVMVFQWWIGTP